MNHFYSPGSSSTSGRRLHVSNTSSLINDRKFLSRQIEPAIAGKLCPICLNHMENWRAAVITSCMHAYCIGCIKKWSNMKRNCPLCNSLFDSWFFRFSFSSRTFWKQKLPPLDQVPRFDHGDFSNQSAGLGFVRLREDSIGKERTRPLPRCRSFGNPRLVLPDIIRERVLQWRKSIYEQRLQAVACSKKKFQEQDLTGKKGVKERVLQKIEPWIQRELEAITGDHDPSILVHVATSLYMAALEKKQNPSGHSGMSLVDDNYLEPLRRFLLEETSLFWHELRCFAESSLNMDTYDTVVIYVHRED